MVMERSGKNKLTDSNNHHHHRQQKNKTTLQQMNRKPLKLGDEDDCIGCPREEDEPRGLPRRGGHQEHSPMEVEERLLDNHAWMWNKSLSIIYHPRQLHHSMQR